MSQFKPVFIQLYKVSALREERITLSSYERDGQIYYHEVKEEKVISNWVGNRIGNYYKTANELNNLYLEYRKTGYKTNKELAEESNRNFKPFYK